MLQFWRDVERTNAMQVCYGGGLARQFLQFLEKNNRFNVIWIIFRTFLRPVEGTKLLRLRIYLKFLNCAALFIYGSSSNHI